MLARVSYDNHMFNKGKLENVLCEVMPGLPGATRDYAS